jgi:membrane protease YdiL (CAAX protease family)
MNNDKKAFIIYLIIVFSLSAIIETLWIIFGESATNAGISSFLMFIPFMAALIVSKIYYKKQNKLGFNKCNPKYIFLAVVFPLIYLGFSYGFYWLFYKDSYVGNLSVLVDYASIYNQNISSNSAIIISLIITLIVTGITAFGEEVGWRGFMYPVMQRILGWKKAIIISGGIWTLWHLPLVVSGLYLSETIMVYRIPVFIIEVFALTVIITWIRMRSKSVWPAIIFHAVHNYLDQIIFQSLTKNIKSAYFVGETGFITIIFTVIIAVLIIIRGKNTFEQMYCINKYMK